MEDVLKILLMFLFLPLLGACFVIVLFAWLIPGSIGIWIGFITATILLWALSGVLLGYTIPSAIVLTIILSIAIFKPDGVVRKEFFHGVEQSVENFNKDWGETPLNNGIELPIK